MKIKRNYFRLSFSVIIFLLFISTISAQYQYEPNNTFAEAEPINLNQAYSAAIYQAYDRDYYVVEIAEPGVVHITVSGIASNIDMDVFLYDAPIETSEIESSTSYNNGVTNNLYEKVCEPGTYYILLKDGKSGNDNDNSTMLYTLYVDLDTSDEYECNDTFGTASEIFSGEPISASIFDDYDRDYYKFEVTVASVISVQVINVPNNIDMDVFLYDAPNDFSEIESSTGFSTGVDFTTYEKVCMPGTYYLLLKDGSTGNDNDYSSQQYDLLLTINGSDIYECNDDFDSATCIEANQIINAAIYDDYDLDYYKVIVPSSCVVRAEVTNIANNIDLDVYMYDAPNNFAEIESSTGTSNGVDVTIYGKTCGPDTLYLLLKDGTAGNDNDFSSQLYTLRITIDSTDVYECNDNFEDATCINSSQIIHANINDEYDLDYYKIPVPAGSILSIAVTNVPDNIDLDLYLYDDSNTNALIGSSTGTSSGVNVSIQRKFCQADTIYLLLKDGSSFGENDLNTQLYTLAIDIDTSDIYECNESPADAAVIAPCSDTLYAAINLDGDQDYFSFEAPANILININVKNIPPNIDMNLELYTPDGLILDDSGDNGAPVKKSHRTTIQGTYILRLYDSGNNNSNADLYQICIELIPEFNLDPDLEDLCIDEAPVQLSGGEPSGGYYSGPGVDSLTGIFNPDVAGVGVHEITFAYIDPITSCSSSVSASITVHDLPDVALVLNPDTISISENPFILTGGAPFNGDYSGTGVDDNIFYPTLAELGHNIITYTYTDAFGCSNTASDTLTVIQTTSTSSPDFGQQVQVFPNPFTAILNIELNEVTSGPVHIELFQANGESCFQSTFNSSHIIQLPTIKLQTGFYFLKIQTEEGSVTKKVIKY